MFGWLFGKPTRGQLLRELVSALERLAPGARAEAAADQAALTVHLDDGRSATMDLGEAFTAWAAAPRGHRSACAEKLMRELLGSVPPARAPTTTEPLHTLRPRLITTAGLQARLLQVLPQLDLKGGFRGVPLDQIKGRIAARPLAGSLHVAVVQDLPTTVAFLVEQEGPAAGFEPRFRRALTNLAQSASQPFRQLAPGVFSGETADQHGAATMLLEDAVRALPVVGAPVAFAPCSEQCLVTGDGNTQGLELALKRARAAYESGKVRPLTAEAFVLRARGWEPWSPGEGHPLHGALSGFLELHRAEEYALQAELLSRTSLPAPAERVYFTSDRSREPVPGAAPSASLWEEGGELLLPEADYVGFMPRSGTPSFVRWLAALEVLGSRMQPVDGLVPRRFYVRGFPSSSELYLMSSLSAAMSSTVQN